MHHHLTPCPLDSVSIRKLIICWLHLLMTDLSPEAHAVQSVAVIAAWCENPTHLPVLDSAVQEYLEEPEHFRACSTVARNWDPSETASPALRSLLESQSRQGVTELACTTVPCTASSCSNITAASLHKSPCRQSKPFNQQPTSALCSRNQPAQCRLAAAGVLSGTTRFSVLCTIWRFAQLTLLFCTVACRPFAFVRLVLRICFK